MDSATQTIVLRILYLERISFNRRIWLLTTDRTERRRIPACQTLGNFRERSITGAPLLAFLSQKRSWPQRIKRTYRHHLRQAPPETDVSQRRQMPSPCRLPACRNPVSRHRTSVRQLSRRVPHRLRLGWSAVQFVQTQSPAWRSAALDQESPRLYPRHSSPGEVRWHAGERQRSEWTFPP